MAAKGTGAILGGAAGAYFGGGTPMATMAGASLGASLEGIFGGGSAARRAAEMRATALKKAANARLEQGKKQSEALIAQGGADRTTELSSMLGRGVSRNASITDISLDEIANRAMYASDQALEQARLDAESIMADAGAMEQQGRNATDEMAYGAMGSILSLGASAWKGKFGDNAWKTGWDGKPIQKKLPTPLPNNGGWLD